MPVGVESYCSQLTVHIVLGLATWYDLTVHGCTYFLYSVCSVQCVFCTVCVLYSVCSVQCVICTVCSVQCVFCTVCVLYSVCSVQCVICTVCSVQCVFCTVCADASRFTHSRHL